MAGKKTLPERVQLKNLDSLFGINQEQTGQVLEVSIRDLFPFQNHPFKVLDDDKMLQTVDSIRENGILAPIMVRNRLKGGYEVISGHRRKHAAEIVGLETVPVIIRDLTDDEAVIAMVDANLQREEILPSEKAYAYKMKLDALSHQGKKFHIRDKKKFVIQNLPYLFLFYPGNILSAHVRSYIGGDILDKIFKAILEIGKISFIPSIHLIDIMVGIIVAALIKVIVYTKGKNAKKFRQGKEYGSARWVA